MKTNRVLLVDDDACQRKLGRLQLVAAGYEVECAEDAKDALMRARHDPPSAIVSDVAMAELDGFAFCQQVRRDPSLRGVPVILTSAYFGGVADQALAARVGANWLVPRTPDFAAEIEALRLILADGAPPPPSAEGAEVDAEHLRRVNAQLVRLATRAQSSEARYHQLLDAANDNVCVINRHGVFVEANRRMEQTLKVARGELVGRHISEFAPPGRAQANVAVYNEHLHSGRAQTAMPVSATDGTVSLIEFASSVVEIDGHQQVLSIGRDVTESTRVAEALRASEERYRSLVERLPDVIFTRNANGEVTFITANVEQMSGYTAEELRQAGGDALWISRIHEDDRERVHAAHDAFLAGKASSFEYQYRFQRKDGRWIWLKSRSSARYFVEGVAHSDGILDDVTAERQLEESLRQAQKIEAVGQLAGGIAHDFNNILAVILTNCQFMLELLPADSALRPDAEDIAAAAERAVTLTRQLTAFSRKQVLEPKVVNLNSSIADVWKMIRRVIGEDIKVATAFDPAVGNAFVDVTQISQVVMNLVLNARDALPNGGTLTLETRNADLDEDYAATHAGAKPGHYVLLSVSDDGIGMDAGVKARCFEPFFTTKDRGRGTGLGLSMVYGIVKQSGGYICVYSEPGRGTCFKVYLPRVDAEVQPSTERPEEANLRSRGERVLLVEDDAMVRPAVERVLKTYGYAVDVADSPGQAIQRFQDQPHAYDLVLTDVILPLANGREVAGALVQLNPALKVLFMSGFSDHAIVQQGVLEPGVNFIQKPFTPLALARKLRAVLG